jgi:hypothetical protein
MPMWHGHCSFVSAGISEPSFETSAVRDSVFLSPAACRFEMMGDSEW